MCYSINLLLNRYFFIKVLVCYDLQAIADTKGTQIEVCLGRQYNNFESLLNYNL
jgi:hypothetical protein